MKYLILSLSFLLAPTLYAQWTIESVPNQKLVNGSYVSNPDGILTVATTTSLDAMLKDLEDSTTVQVAIVAVKSIGDADIFTFAQDLFTYWGIGQKENDNGLLILLVEDTHTIRFHTGYGVEGVLTDGRCKRIQQTYMVPLFKEGDYNGGVLAGVEVVAKTISDPAYADELEAGEESSGSGDFAAPAAFLCFLAFPVLLIAFLVKLVNKSFSNSKNPSHTDYPEMRVTQLAWAVEFLFMPAVIVAAIRFSDTEQPFFAIPGLYLYFLATLLHRQWRMKRVMRRLTKDRDYHGVVEFLRGSQVYWFFMALFYPLPFLPYFFYHLARKRRYRNHPRTCNSCQATMVKLDEKADDAYLSQAQQVEETIHSLDYDVWQCTACQNTEMWNYPGRSSRYEKCSYCSSKTSYFMGQKTLRAATYSAAGQGERTYGCAHCGKLKRKTYSISKLEHTSSSSSSSSGSSSSSSSGGSWGGGSSGGGGASSSW